MLWQEIIFSGGSHGGEIVFAVSRDGGRSFGPPVNLSRSRAGDGKGRLNRDTWRNGSLDIAAAPGGRVSPPGPTTTVDSGSPAPATAAVRSASPCWWRAICVMRSKVEPMKDVAALVRRHLEGIVAWAQTRMTNGFLEALNGLFQAAKRRARGFQRFETIKTVIF